MPDIRQRSISGADHSNPWGDLLSIAHTHSLSGVDVLFGIYELLPPICMVSGKLCQIARPLGTIKQMCGFREGYNNL